MARHTLEQPINQTLLTIRSRYLSIDIDVDSGSVSSAIEVTLKAQYVVFNVPGTDAGLTFSWGGVDDDSLVSANIPFVDLLVEQPVTEGMEVYISMIVASPFGQMTAHMQIHLN